MANEGKLAVLSGAATLFVAGMGGGLRLAFPDMIVPFEWALALFFVCAAGFVLTLIFGRLWLRGKQKAIDPPISPIRIVGPFVDFEFVADDEGANADKFYWYSICIDVENALSDGTVLRNVTARTRSFIGVNVVLPVRSGGGSADIQHGQTARFELGRALLPLSEGNAVHGMPSGKLDRYIVPKAQLDYLNGPDPNHRTFEMNNLGGEPQRVSQVRELTSEVSFVVVFTADGVVSLSAKIVLDLFSTPEEQRLITIISSDEDD